MKGNEFGEKLLLEDFRQKYENFRWYSNARLSVNRFFFIFFVAISGLIGYFLSPTCPLQNIGIDIRIVIGIIANLSGIVGLLLIWTNVAFSFGLDDTAWAIEYFQRECPKTSEILKYVKDAKYPKWVNPNRLQLICMLIIYLLYFVLSMIFIFEVWWLIAVFSILHLAVLCSAAFYYYSRKKFKSGLDLSFK